MDRIIDNFDRTGDDNPMNIENLKTFLTLSELKNFTQTADQYYIVQSTVTNRIMELEKELGKSCLSGRRSLWN